MSDPAVVLVDCSDPLIAVVSLNRPEKRNALSVDLIDRLREAVAAAGADKNCRAIVIRGNGPAFCAGLDLNEASSGDSERSAEALAAMYLAICQSPLVTIAAAGGAAYGGGAGLVAACDLCVAGDDLKLAYPEVRRGLVAALVTCLLRRHASDQAVRELVLLGEPVDAHHALSLGLVNRVVPKARLDAAAMDVAREACKGAPGAVARSKRLLDALDARPIEAQLELALEYHLHARHSAEAAEGIAAFREKREPRWGPRE